MLEFLVSLADAIASETSTGSMLRSQFLSKGVTGTLLNYIKSHFVEIKDKSSQVFNIIFLSFKQLGMVEGFKAACTPYCFTASLWSFQRTCSHTSGLLFTFALHL